MFDIKGIKKLLEYADDGRQEPYETSIRGEALVTQRGSLKWERRGISTFKQCVGRSRYRLWYIEHSNFQQLDTLQCNQVCKLTWKALKGILSYYESVILRSCV